MALRVVQWFIRGIQFCCATIILALFSYFLAVMAKHNLRIDNWIRAVEGISGAAVLYTLISLCVLCCVAGHPFTSFFAILLDICFIGAFIYIAAKNGPTGTDSCRGPVNTIFGSGNADQNVFNDYPDGPNFLPSLQQTCNMQTAVLAVSIVGIIFFLMSAIVEVALVRNRRKEKRFGPGPANGYTSGYGSKRGRRGLFGFGRRNKHAAGAGGLAEDPNALPVHATPNDVRDSYATEQTRVEPDYPNGNTGGYNKYEQSGFAPAMSPTPAPGTTENPYYTAPHTTTTAPAQAHTATAAAVNPYRAEYGSDNVSSGITGAGHGTSVHDAATYPAGNYRYDDGVYSSRV